MGLYRKNLGIFMASQTSVLQGWHCGLSSAAVLNQLDACLEQDSQRQLRKMWAPMLALWVDDIMVIICGMCPKEGEI